MPTLSLPDRSFSLEHGLALLTRALSKTMHGRRAHRVYARARAAGLVTNYAAFGLPAVSNNLSIYYMSFFLPIYLSTYLSVYT